MQIFHFVLSFTFYIFLFLEFKMLKMILLLLFLNLQTILAYSREESKFYF